MTDRAVSRTDLFLGFAKVGLLGFGGVAPWARHIIVKERCWLDEREYASILGVSAAVFVVFTDYNLLWALGAAIALGLAAHAVG